MKMIIVDDHSLFRSGLTGVFNAQPDFEVVGEASTIRDALSLFETKKPDLVMLDVSLPDGSGIDAIHRFRKIKEDAAIVILCLILHRTVRITYLGKNSVCTRSHSMG